MHTTDLSVRRAVVRPNGANRHAQGLHLAPYHPCHPLSTLCLRALLKTLSPKRCAAAALSVVASVLHSRSATAMARGQILKHSSMSFYPSWTPRSAPLVDRYIRDLLAPHARLAAQDASCAVGHHRRQLHLQQRSCLLASCRLLGTTLLPHTCQPTCRARTCNIRRTMMASIRNHAPPRLVPVRGVVLHRRLPIQVEPGGQEHVVARLQCTRHQLAIIPYLHACISGEVMRVEQGWLFDLDGGCLARHLGHLCPKVVEHLVPK